MLRGSLKTCVVSTVTPEFPGCVWAPWVHQRVPPGPHAASRAPAELPEGLPPSAIANPGWEAIQATLYPESHSYYFFVSDTDGSTVFAKNEPEHQKNVEALRKAKENGTTID